MTNNQKVQKTTEISISTKKHRYHV